jgi:epoxyqueuosine reductase
MKAREALREAIRAAGLELGFVAVGFTGAEALEPDGVALADWLAQGRAGEMGYLARAPRHAPRALLAEARSVIVAALPCPPAGDRLPAGAIARYAHGRDYHHELWARLQALAGRCASLAGGPLATRVAVDTAPLLERALARRAGLAFVGKSTMAVIPGAGSHVLLGELLVELALPADEPAPPRCGRCHACLTACPTQALVAPFVLDARRCIAYLTIEHKGAIPLALRPLMGARLAGCDACQDACPYNRRGQAAAGPRADDVAARFVDVLLLGSAAYRRFVADSALRRLSRAQLARNAAVALGNLGAPSALPALVQAATRHASPLVRGHAAWALGRLGGDAGLAALRQLAQGELDESVREEAALALASREAAPYGQGPNEASTGA